MTQARPLDLAVIDSLAMDARKMPNRWVHGPVSSDLTRWLIFLSEALAPLIGVHRIPRGPSLFGVLQEAFRNLGSTEASLTRRLPQERTARQLTRAIGRQLRSWLERLLSEVALTLA